MRAPASSWRAVGLLLAVGAIVISIAAPSGAICTILDCLTETSDLEVARSGAAALQPMKQAGSEGFARVHQWGTVAATTKAGDLLWERQPTSLIDDWGRERWSKVPPLVYTGPVAEWGKGWNAENALVTHDVTADGVDEVIVVHNDVRHREDGTRGVFLQSVVSVLDGRTGATLWSRPSMAIVPTIQLVDGTLIIAEENGEPTGSISWNGEPGGISSLRALRFSPASGSVEATELWVRDSSQGAWSRWTGPVAAGPGRIAVAVTPAEGTTSTLAMLDVSTGTVLWGSTSGGFIDHIRYDPLADEIVSTERRVAVPAFLGPVGAGLEVDGFHVNARRATDGAVRISTPVTTAGSPQALALGDVTGDGRTEWIVSHHPTTRGTLEVDMVRSRVTAIDGGLGLPLWERTVGSSGLPAPADRLDPMLPPTTIHSVSAYGLAVEDGMVLVASSISWTKWIENWDLRTFDGATGDLVWSKDAADALTPHSLLTTETGGEATLFGVTGAGTHRGYALEDGSERASSAVLNQVHAAVAIHVDDDGVKEIIVGTRSGGVFALDARGFTIEMPDIHWQTDVDGRVQEMRSADVDGDGRSEIVVAAENEVAVLDATTGRAVSRIEQDDAYVWTVGLADIDGDGATDLLVPTTGVDAYRGKDGSHMWRFEPPLSPGNEAYVSNVAVVDGIVVTQYNVRAAGEDGARDLATGAGLAFGGPSVASDVVGIDLATGESVWTRASTVEPVRSVSLWRGVAPAPAWQEAPARAVAVASPGDGGGDSWTIDVLDARTGQPLTAEPIEVPGAVLGMEPGAAGHLVAYTMDGPVEIRADGGQRYEIGGTPVTATVFDAAHGSFGELGDLTVLGTGSMAMLLEPDAFEEGTPQAAIALASFSAGRVLVTDLEEDGVDELLILEHPYGSLDAVWEKAGGFYKHTTAKGSGLTLVRVGPG